MDVASLRVASHRKSGLGVVSVPGVGSEENHGDWIFSRSTYDAVKLRSSPCDKVILAG